MIIITSGLVLASSSVGRAFSVVADICSFCKAEESGKTSALDSMPFQVSYKIITKDFEGMCQNLA